ncbi:MAG TPA: glycolate oxidase subunit GlcF [Alphaproteobacteria bacterium]|jgi:glycolate oxidase iron-sulfur subunit|nr:glycolate oxidase subunit GlcF [Alphaproteobacteria bacterium]
MQTRFTTEQLADPAIRDCERNIRACVHCGFCLATCPTYTLLGDELDSPRGRIYLIKDMLENDRPATEEVALHVDRCLSCLACQTTCPSGVNYQHLIDHARAHVEETYRRPWFDRTLRAVLAWLLPYPGRFRLALRAAALARPFAGLLKGRPAAMMALAPARLPSPGTEEGRQVFPAVGPRRKRVALLMGCAQRVVAPSINAATIRLLNRHGVEVVVPPPVGCCGAIVHHLGRADQARGLATAAIEGWVKETAAGGLDAIVVNTSGCGTEIKDYGHIFRDDPIWATPARAVSSLARDISEFLDEIGIKPIESEAPRPIVAYHSACSLQHGQKVTRQPQKLLTSAGFTVREIPEGHLCCGSAGTYNLLQPEIAGRLRDRKLANIAEVSPDIVATGNVGCITQLSGHAKVPVVHTVELLDWATGGPVPEGLAGNH